MVRLPAPNIMVIREESKEREKAEETRKMILFAYYQHQTYGHQQRERE